VGRKTSSVSLLAARACTCGCLCGEKLSVITYSLPPGQRARSALRIEASGGERVSARLFVPWLGGEVDHYSIDGNDPGHESTIAPADSDDLVC
jgi:hypothetical protein